MANYEEYLKGLADMVDRLRTDQDFGFVQTPQQAGLAETVRGRAPMTSFNAGRLQAKTTQDLPPEQYAARELSMQNKLILDIAKLLSRIKRQKLDAEDLLDKTTKYREGQNL